MARIDRSIRISLRDLNSLVAACRQIGMKLDPVYVESLECGGRGFAHLHADDVERFFGLRVATVGDARRVIGAMQRKGFTSAVLWEGGLNGRQVIDRAAA